MNLELASLRAAGVVSDLDYHFAVTLSGLVHGSDLNLLLALALCSRQTRSGHVCTLLERFAGQLILDETGTPLDSEGEGPRWPNLRSWLTSLTESALVSAGEQRTPLVLDGARRLYLYRYWEHEQRIAELLRSRLGLHPDAIDQQLLKDGLDRLFAPMHEADTQRDAALLALTQRVCTVIGGPGTGKTSTVARILALLSEQSLEHRGRGLESLLLAPTGKAAARLSDAIRAAKTRLDCSDRVKQAIVEGASTIHRALGSRRGSATEFLHGREHPLTADLVLVDEASMVDAALMRRLLEALPKDARLILLGDRHQLASVEAGAVLSDITGRAEHPGYAPRVVKRVAELSGSHLRARASTDFSISDTVVELTRSYRFGADSGIARFARAVNRGDADAAVSLLQAGTNSELNEELALVEGAQSEPLLERLEARSIARFRHWTEPGGPAEALQRLEEFRVLCAHRKGPLGVERVNQRLLRALEREAVISAHLEWYRGRPILITQNDHQLKLYNGDVGLIWPDADGTLRAFFPAGGGQTRAISTARLPPHETVYAMSIHKSQGSEFKEVAVVLPRPESPLLTRELLYTAVTRARTRAVLYGDLQSVRAGVQRPVARASGLEALLHGE